MQDENLWNYTLSHIMNEDVHLLNYSLSEGPTDHSLRIILIKYCM